MTDSAYPGTELEALAAAPNYYRWILHWFGERLRGRVLEVGAGVGTFADNLVGRPRIERLTLVEPATNLVGRLEERFRDRDDVDVFHGYLHESPIREGLDAVVMVNVLEHIEDDRATLETIHGMLRPGGAVLIFVPALPWLYGSLDHAFQHCRRYTRPGLGALLSAAGFRTERLRYMNLPGILSWLMAGRVLRLDTIRPASMRLYDGLVVPVARAIEDRLEPPLGQNLLAVAVKTTVRQQGESR